MSETVNWRKKNNRKRRKKTVPMQYLQHPKPSLTRRLLPYVLAFVVLFWFLHIVLHLG